jgi:phosphoglycerate kinase
MNTIESLDVQGKRVLLRLDLNLPLKDGKVEDDTRLTAALPTINLLKDAGAKLIICSHLGRPKGQRVPKLSLMPVAEKLAEHMKDSEIFFAHDCIGEDVEFLSKELKPGNVMLIENLRFHKGESTNDKQFTQQLSKLADIYVNDAFGVLHRDHSSVTGIVGHMQSVAVGPLVLAETEALSKLKEQPERPFIAIVGGAKVSDKLKVLESLMTRVDTIIVGGAMAYTFLASKGHEIGNSLVEPDRFNVAQKIISRCAQRGVELILPVDHIVAETISSEPSTVTYIPSDKSAFDIGPETMELFSEAISKAKTIFWNGPMGMTEVETYADGTRAVAKAVASADAYSVIGGGDSAAAANKLEIADCFSHISTGGGASLSYIQGSSLPGLVAIKSAATK